jgi:hypothetical protein
LRAVGVEQTLFIALAVLGGLSVILGIVILAMSESDAWREGGQRFVVGGFILVALGVVLRVLANVKL